MGSILFPILFCLIPHALTGTTKHQEVSEKVIMEKFRPVIGITMGDPAGIGPEIILLSLSNPLIYKICKPIVMGDPKILKAAAKYTNSDLELNRAADPDKGMYKYGFIDVINSSDLNPESFSLGQPTAATGRAMMDYITTAMDLALEKKIAAMVTCPINKSAMKMAGSKFSGHTEMLADRTGSDNFAMMLAGDRLRIVLVTIHIPLKKVPQIISTETILKTIKLTNKTLIERFGIKNPAIAVAGLNPHAGEGGMFGDEEERIISPAIKLSKNQGINISGPFPPDTVFYHAANGDYHAVVCMYHDQGLIPFKLIHFTNGVNTTLGLPIIRTSVDHGTAYDIAGTGKADPGSLSAAITMAVQQAKFDSKISAR